jgi:hypothetical protein
MVLCAHLAGVDIEECGREILRQTANEQHARKTLACRLLMGRADPHVREIGRTNMIWWVSLASLVLSVLSFLLFGMSVMSPKTREPGAVAAPNVQIDVEGWAKIAEAVAKIIESMSKAGPSTLTLASSIVFMVISFLAAKV